MPVLRRELAGDQGGTRPHPIIDHLLLPLTENGPT
jgi:hypothetical protein